MYKSEMNKKWVIYEEMYQEPGIKIRKYGKIRFISDSFEETFKIYFDVFFISELMKFQYLIDVWIYHVPTDQIPLYIKDEHDAISKNFRFKLQLNFEDACMSLSSSREPEIVDKVNYLFKQPEYLKKVLPIHLVLKELQGKDKDHFIEIIINDNKSRVPKWIRKINQRGYLTSFVKKRAFAIKYINLYIMLTPTEFFSFNQLD